MTQLTGKAPELDLELDSEIADGIYSNLAIISHSASEFVVDFATILPGLAKPKIRSRIVLTPEHAKRLMLSLQDNIARYEASNGLIGLTPTAAEESTMPLGFCNKGEAGFRRSAPANRARPVQIERKRGKPHGFPRSLKLQND